MPFNPEHRQSPTFWGKYGNAIAYLLVVVGIVVAFQANNITSQHRDEHTRSVVCLILQQSDTATYQYAEAHKISFEQLQKSLEISAGFRRELGPAAHCNPNPTRPGESYPLGRPSVPGQK